MDPFTYTDRQTREISFPLGGIGSGCIGLAGNGRLIDWEIANRPAKGTTNGFSHFAIKAESKGQLVDARVLHGDLQPPYSGAAVSSPWSQGVTANFGFGPSRDFLTGLPHFRDVSFCGQYPMADLQFKEPAFPGQVRLTAFNPFIPLEADDSSLPAAFFEYQITNSSRQPLTYTLAATLANPLPASNRHSYHHSPDQHLLHLKSDAFSGTEPTCGDLCIGTDAAKVGVQQYWFKGAWFDSLEVYWRDFASPGPMPSRRYSKARAGEQNHATLTAALRLSPGQRGKVRFVLSWNFPNCQNYWNSNAGETACEAGLESGWKNHYATRFKDARASAQYALAHWRRLHRDTLKFKEALFASDLPVAALDAVAANISILKTPTALRLEDGTFYGWEGCHPDAGCCEGSCTHVWNYAQALPFLFPQLERSMRTADYRYNLRPDGGMAFRLQLPIGTPFSGFRPCADGQFGGVIKAYRDWKISGDSAWLASIWDGIKQSIDFTWSPANQDQWDPDQTGVLQGRQHHTLDMELFGPNAWLTGFYLAALKAGAEIAEHFGEDERAAHYRALFQRGKAWTDQHLFNGEYYQQKIDLSDRKLLRSFGAQDQYWNSEHKEIKYQVDQGCGLDQVLAQWHANLYGLGEIFDPRQTKKALRSIYKYNFKASMRQVYNPCRIYSLNDEAGLLICEWPKGRPKPMIPLTYAQETMNGFEYAAAIHMIQAGLVKEGMRAVTAIRDRYDGDKRNPWNEFECGSNYARSMASYALLNAFSGLSFNLVENRLGFAPVVKKNEAFTCFWSLGTGWGLYRQRSGKIELEVLHGFMALKHLDLPQVAASVKTIRLGARSLTFSAVQGTLTLARRARLKPGRTLVLSTAKAEPKSS
ncbi:MAG: hypothetical protein GKR89_16065 [Candidatus Latescibacteria bacterium]|nr:hypothetical protein [Candidatus Latescibacterota bacterium]